ncbi:MAG: phage tail assembly chaperone [Clostridia bacterium]|nr:phage tail assembly chaperone [Clostridia bacterium]
MRQNVEFASRPEEVTFDNMGEVCQITLADNIKPAPASEDGEERFTADLYTVTVTKTPDLEQRVRGNLRAFLNDAKIADAILTAHEVREKRDALLRASDAHLALDRFGITLPDKITATSMLTALTGLVDGLKKLINGDWAKYRQALRDLPKQPGFPHNVTWPTPPDDE